MQLKETEGTGAPAPPFLPNFTSVWFHLIRQTTDINKNRNTLHAVAEVEGLRHRCEGKTIRVAGSIC